MSNGRTLEEIKQALALAHSKYVERSKAQQLIEAKMALRVYRKLERDYYTLLAKSDLESEVIGIANSLNVISNGFKLN